MPIWNDPERYLGLPRVWGRSKSKALEWIQERVCNKIECWKESLLNQAGKEILIKVVLQAIPSYAMSILKLPKTFCQKLCSRVARFWWSKSGG
jgi:hypothetical protein